MIVNGLVSFLVTVIGGLVSLIPGWTWPTWFSGTAGGSCIGTPDTLGCYSSNVGGYLQQLHNWLPVTALGNALAVVGVALVAAGSIRITRMVISALTGGGGS